MAVRAINKKFILCICVMILTAGVSLLSFSSQASTRLADKQHRSNLCVAAMIYAEMIYRTEEEVGKAGDADIQEIIQTDLARTQGSILSPKAASYDYSLDARDPQYIYIAVRAIRETIKLLSDSENMPSSLNVMRYGFPSCMTALQELNTRFEEAGE